MTQATGAARADLIQGLLSLAAFLTTHPDVPVDLHVRVSALHFPPGPLAEQREAVDRVAAQIGCPAGPRGAHYGAVRRFGPVEYAAVAIPLPSGQQAAA